MIIKTAPDGPPFHALDWFVTQGKAGRSLDVARLDYVHWAQLFWGGQVNQLMTVVESRHKQLGPPPDGDETSPAAVVTSTLRYLKKQRTRIKHNE